MYCKWTNNSGAFLSLSLSSILSDYVCMVAANWPLLPMDKRLQSHHCKVTFSHQNEAIETKNHNDSIISIDKWDILFGEMEIKMGNQEIEIKTSESHFMNDDLFRTFCFKSIYYYCYCFWNCFCEFEILIFFHRHNNGRAKPHQTLNSCVIHAIV